MMKAHKGCAVRWCLAWGVACAAMQAHALSAVDLYAKVSPSVWKVVVFDAADKPFALGSAVVVGTETLVTNCHVIEKARRLQVRRESIVLEAQSDVGDPDRDLCQLKVKGLQAPAVPLFDTSRVQVGQVVYAIGNPRGLDLTLSSGLVSAVRRDDEGRIQFIQTTAAISGGSSGGGLFDEEGRLLGLTTMAARDVQNLNFAIPADFIKDLWASHQAAPGRGDAPATAATAPAPAPTPAPTAAAAPAMPRGSYRVGDEYEYAIVDEYTGQRERVVYRVDEVSDRHVRFNGGARTEGLDGVATEMVSVIGGDMDAVAPPDGWHGVGQKNASAWSVKFNTRVADVSVSYDLDAVSEGRESITTAAGEFGTRVIRYSGWATRTTAYGITISLRVNVRVWYSAALKRVVRLQSHIRPSTNGLYAYAGSKQTIELSRIHKS